MSVSELRSNILYIGERQHMPPFGESPLSFLESYQSIENELIQARVPLEVIFNEDVPVNQSHVEDLKKLIRLEANENGGTGQLQAILLGEIPGRSRFAVMDGFHRIPAVEQLGRRDILANIRLNCDWEKVIDLRIAAARSHEVVKFARLVDWIEDAWSMTQWSYYVSALQAVSFTYKKRDAPEYAVTGKRLGFSPEEAEQIRFWVNDKCARWNIGTSSIYHYLSAAAIADPLLIKSARESQPGHRAEVVTPLQLHAIAQALPYQFEKQQLVARLTVASRLPIAKARALALEIFDSATIADAIAKIEAINVDEIAPARNLGRTIARRREAAVNHQLVRINTPQFILQRLHELAGAITSDLDPSKLSDADIELAENDISTLRAIGSTCLALVSHNEKKTGAQNFSELENSTSIEHLETTSLKEQPETLHQEQATPAESLKTLSEGNSVDAITALETRIRLYIYEGGTLPKIQTEAEVSALQRALRDASSSPVSHNGDCRTRFKEVTTLLQSVQKNIHRIQGLQVKQRLV